MPLKMLLITVCCVKYLKYFTILILFSQKSNKVLSLFPTQAQIEDMEPKSLGMLFAYPLPGCVLTPRAAPSC